MKVLCITPTVAPEAGGWGRYSYEILSLYKARKVDFVVFAEKTSNFFLSRVFILRPFSVVGFFKNIFLIRRISKGFDVVHAFEGWPYSVYGYLAILGTKKKLFISGHGTYSVAPLDSIIQGFFLKLSYKRARIIFCNSSYTELQILRRVSCAKTMIVPLGTSMLPAPTKNWLGEVTKLLPNSTPLVITVGAIKKRKGQLDVLKAIVELRAEFPNITYVVVGDDLDKDYKDKMMSLIKKNKIEKHIIFKGRVSDQELSAWYTVADVQVLNSYNHDGHFEGFGLVLLEGYRFGLPAIGSRGCGIEDAIVDGKTGFLTNQSDVSNLTANIRKLLNSGKSAYSNNCAIFLSNFNWEKTVNTYISEYEAE